MVTQLMSWHSLLDLLWLIFLSLLLGYFWRDRRRMLHAKDWVKTRGQITDCEFAPYGHRVWPKLQYVYQVADQQFTGELLFLDSSHHDLNSKRARNIAYQIVTAYKQNEEIDVYYNPDKPADSALDISMAIKLNGIIMFIAALIVLHIVITSIRIISH